MTFNLLFWCSADDCGVRSESSLASTTGQGAFALLETENAMNSENVRSGLTAPAIAVVIWVVMALLFDVGSKSMIALWAVIFAVAAFVISTVITTLVDRSKQRDTTVR
jgi:uncharacterized membrane protein